MSIPSPTDSNSSSNCSRKRKLYNCSSEQRSGEIEQQQQFLRGTYNPNDSPSTLSSLTLHSRGSSLLIERFGRSSLSSETTLTTFSQESPINESCSINSDAAAPLPPHQQIKSNEYSFKHAFDLFLAANMSYFTKEAEFEFEFENKDNYTKTAANNFSIEN